MESFTSPLPGPKGVPWPLRRHPLSESSHGKPRAEHGDEEHSALIPWVLVGVAVATLGGLLYVGIPLVRDERASAEAARKESSHAYARASDAESARRALEGRLRTLEEEKLSLLAERDALSGESRQKEAEDAKLKATSDALEEKMQSEIKKGEIRITPQAGGKIRVELVEKLLFASADATVSSRGEDVLSRLALALARGEEKQIQVSGHTDDGPIPKNLQDSYPTNWELSAARAVNVVRFLSEHAKVPAHRLVASGYGPHQPVSSNADATGRARNRRIELLLMPALDALSKTGAQVAKGAASKSHKGARRPKR
jgi:chemotaxis protein MotB